jgi:hypothetical protein
MTRIQYSKVGLSVIFITVSPSDLLFWSVSGIRAELCERVHIARPNLAIAMNKRPIEEDGAEEPASAEFVVQWRDL